MTFRAQATLKPGESLVASALKDGQDDLLIAMIEQGGKEGGLTTEEIFTILRDTRSRTVRNVVAIAIADRRPVGGSEVLTEVLARPWVAREAGTLIYALDEIGGCLPLPTFVSLLEQGSYEARAEALLFLDQDRVSTDSDSEIDEAYRRLSALAASDDREEADAASDAIAVWPARWLRGREAAGSV